MNPALQLVLFDGYDIGEAENKQKRARQNEL